jgi:hypothetical protein
LIYPEQGILIFQETEELKELLRGGRGDQMNLGLGIGTEQLLG